VRFATDTVGRAANTQNVRGNKKLSKRMVVLVVLLLLISNCTKKNILDIEYQVYSAVIDSLYPMTSINIPFVLIGDSTRICDVLGGTKYYEMDLKEITKDILKTEQEEILENYIEANKKLYSFDHNGLKIKYVPVTVTSKNYISTIKNQYEKFGIPYNREAGGYFFSRIGFTKNRKYALLFYDFCRGGCNGWPAYCFLEKKDDIWSVVEDYPLGIY